MTRPAFRSTLLLVFVTVIAVGGWWVVQTARAAESERQHADALEIATHRLLALASEAGTALPASVAFGQGEAFWHERVADDLGSLQTELATLRGLSLGASALNDIDAAAAAIEELAAVTERVSAMVRLGDGRQASEAIFGEGLERLGALRQRIEAAWQSEREASAARARTRDAQLAAVFSGTIGLALLVVGILALVGRGKPSARPGEVSAADALPMASAGGVPVTSPATVPPVSAQTPPNEPIGIPDRDQPLALGALSDGVSQDRRKSTELTAAADLCTDFARLGDAAEVPALLERAARLLDASGLIVWVVDPAAEVLRPSLTQGYPPQAVARLPAIPRDADNATAAAWRDSEIQVVRTNGMTLGALAVPLLTCGGCIGVLATEVRHGREASASVRALTRLVAAQVAPLLTFPESADQAPAERPLEAQA